MSALDGRLAAILAAGALVGFAGCGDEENEVPSADDVQQQIDEGQQQLEQGQEDAQDALNEAEDAVEVSDGRGEAQEQLEQEAQEQLQGEGGE